MSRLQIYGRKKIVMERDEVDAIKKFDDPGLVLIGFKPMEKLKLHHHIRPAVFLYPEEGEVKGAVCLSVCDSQQEIRKQQVVIFTFYNVQELQ